MTAPAARVTSPGQLAALVPELLGFVPEESLVLLCQHEPRGRVGLVLRCDLADGPRLAAELGDRLRHERATRASFVVVTEGDDDQRALADALLAAVAAAGLPVVEALLVRGGRWSSYTCARPCCPPSGTPLPPPGEGPLGLVAAERVLRGGVLRPSRAALADLTRAADPLPDAVLQGASDDLLADLEADRPRAVGGALELLAGALRAPHALDDAAVARCVVALALVGVRDAVLVRVGDDPAAVRALGERLVAAAPARWAGPPLVVLGTGAYAQGDGALAALALQRAVDVEPAGTMAPLLLQALDGQVPPAHLRRVLAPPGGRPGAAGQQARRRDRRGATRGAPRRRGAA